MGRKPKTTTKNFLKANVTDEKKNIGPNEAGGVAADRHFFSSHTDTRNKKECKKKQKKQEKPTNKHRKKQSRETEIQRTFFLNNEEISAKHIQWRNICTKNNFSRFFSFFFAVVVVVPSRFLTDRRVPRCRFGAKWFPPFFFPLLNGEPTTTDGFHLNKKNPKWQQKKSNQDEVSDRGGAKKKMAWYVHVDMKK